MKSDPPAAALRLSSALPCRTHFRAEPALKQGGDRSRFAKRKTIQHPGAGSGGQNRKRVIIGRREFASITAARQWHKCSIFTIYAMLADGRARYVSGAAQRMVQLARGSYRCA